MKILAVIYISVLTLLSGCFPEDERLPVYVLPEGTEQIIVNDNMYNNHIFIDFSSGEVKSTYKNTECVLGFECSNSGWHVIINSSNYWGVYNTMSDNFDAKFSESAGGTWKLDNANGNLDSTAVGNWVNISDSDTTYSRNVYFLGQYDGIKYNEEYKVQFIGISGYEYILRVMDSKENIDTLYVAKNSDFNFVYLSIDDKSVLFLEPEKTAWDIELTQYADILYDSDGDSVLYFLRGALLNEFNTEAVADSVSEFDSITYLNVIDYQFTNQNNVIGWEWKDVKINKANNTAEYTINPNRKYILHDNEGNYFKFHFTGFHNKKGVKGFPTIEFVKLEL